MNLDFLHDRRSFLKWTGALPLLGYLATQDLAEKAWGAIGKTAKDNVYSRIGVRPFINARGTWTYLSGSLELPQVKAAKQQAADYFVDMLAALKTADDITSFFIRAHMGNYSLFLSGVFPDRIRVRSERRGAPDIRYYEEIGRSSFRAASDHRLAHKYDVADIFCTLSERFQTTRKALNDLGDRLISLEPLPKLGI